MTIVRRWTVTMFAPGDRALDDQELRRFDDAVGGVGGTATTHEQHGYGIEIAIAAATHDEALTIGTDVFAAAARRAALPEWPVARAEARDDSALATTPPWPAPAAPPAADDTPPAG